MFAAYDATADAEEIARVGILASCEFDNACDLPIAIYSLELKEDSSSEGIIRMPKAR